MSNYCRLFIFCVVSSLCGTAFADDASHRAVAKEIIELTSPKSFMITAFMSTFEPSLQQLAQMGIPAKAIEQIRAEGKLLAEKVANDPEMMKQMTTIYTELFTESELNELLAFYKTPTGQKTLKEMPILLQKGAQMGQEVGMKYMPDFESKVRTIIEANMSPAE